jgi:hypothetical protein
MGEDAMEVGHLSADGFGDPHRFIAIDTHQQNREFLIADAAKQILGPQLGGAGVAKVSEDPIAGPMAPTVVDLAEIIHINVE